MNTDLTPFHSRSRNKNFTSAEVELFLKLLDKYKYIIFEKSSKVQAWRAKDNAWKQLTKEFNSHRLGVYRTQEALKTKCDNFKKYARQYLYNSTVDDHSKNDVYDRVLVMIRAAHAGDLVDRTNCNNVLQSENHDKTNKNEYNDEKDSLIRGEISEKLNDDKFKREKKKNKCVKNFTMRECKLLLNCVKQDKYNIFSASFVKKRKAWKRVCESFNKQSHRKRTWEELFRKFHAMKSFTCKLNMNVLSNKRSEESIEQLNGTPVISDVKVELQSDFSDSSTDKYGINKSISELNDTNNFNSNCDPLTSHSQSIDTEKGLSNLNSNDEVKKLQLELVNYQMETAKMERKRLEMRIKDEQSEREIRSLEMSLKLRAARLEVLAAESKFSANNPALVYTAEEFMGQSYIQESMHNNG